MEHCFPSGHALRVTFPCSVVNNLLSCSERAILRYESGLNSLYLAPFHHQLRALCLPATLHWILDVQLTFHLLPNGFFLHCPFTTALLSHPSWQSPPNPKCCLLTGLDFPAMFLNQCSLRRLCISAGHCV